MSGKIQSFLLSLAIITVLVFGALRPSIAYADEGTPPDTPPTESTDACTAEGDCPSGEEAVEATGVPVEATAEATSVPEELPTEVPTEGDTSDAQETAPAAEESAPDSSVLDQVPDDTIITVLNTDGQAEPLAAQDAADAIATSDPIWCPAGQAPTPGANGCTPSFTSFNELLTFLSGNAGYQGAGTIYIQQGNYAGGESTIDFNSPSYDLNNISSSDLTVTGGWNTSTNVVDPAATSTFTVPILIGSGTNPWGGSLFVNNITINNPADTGLTLHSAGEIVLVNVNVTNSTNGAGADLNAGGDVTINNSNFNRNKTAGATIRSGGNVAVANSSFSNPANARRQTQGLEIISDGSVALFNVLANENREVGANINAVGRVSISNGFFSGTKAMQGSGASTIFLGYGLQVVTPDAIDLAFVEANDNFLWGASLQAGGDVTIADSIFNANTTESPGFIDDTGLLVTSGGKVALNNVQANDNRLIGATINATGDVAINNSTFNNNNGVTLDSSGNPTFHGYGLNVVTLGNIAVNLVTASNNTLFGAHLDSGGDTAVSDSTFSNNTSGDQTGRGLEIISDGSVFLTNVVVDNNQTFGADVQAGGDIFLDNVTATNNGADGVDVTGACTTVFLINGNYSNNGGYGLSVVNAAVNQSGAPIFANNAAGDLFQDPGTCTFPPLGTGGSPVFNPTPGGAQVNQVQVALQQNTSFSYTGIKGASASGLTSDLSLNDYTVHLRTANGELSVFIGKYAYVHTDAGIRIIALSSNSLVMDGS